MYTLSGRIRQKPSPFPTYMVPFNGTIEDDMKKTFDRKERKWIKGKLKANGYFIIPQKRLTQLAASNLAQRNQWYFDAIRAGQEPWEHYWKFQESATVQRRRTQLAWHRTSWALWVVGLYGAGLIGFALGVWVTSSG